jgi:hypothetical protein
MLLLFKNKITAFAILILLSIAGLILMITNSSAQKNTASTDNIVVVKKHKYNNLMLAAKQFQAFQKVCTIFKEAGYKDMGLAMYASRNGEYLNLDEISKLDDITVTEYFRGTDYARYEEGQTWEPSFKTAEQKNAPETTFDCRMIPKRIAKAEIRTLNQHMLISNLANDENGLVNINVVNQPNLAQGYSKKKLPNNLTAEKIPNSNFECLSSPAILPCYFKDVPIHAGTNREVVLQSKVPAKGLSPMFDASSNMPVPILDVIEKDAYKTGDIVKIYEHVSVLVGKEIPNNKFEIPEFAKDYKVVKK